MIVFLTTSDTDILALEGARDDLPPSLSATVAVNPFALAQDDEAFGRFLSDTLPSANLLLARLLGGDKAMGESFARLEGECRRLNIPLVACSGEPTRDAVFERRSTTPAVVAQTAFEYLNYGGVGNLGNLLRFMSDEALGSEHGYEPPAPLPQDGVYRAGRADAVPLAEYRRLYCDADKPTAALLFYRAHWVSRNLEFVDAMVDRAGTSGCNALPVFCSSLREDDGAVFRKYLMDDNGDATVDVVVCTQSFAMSHQPGLQAGNNIGANSADANWDIRALERLDTPILQAIVSTEPQAAWRERDIGLSPLDIAMNVALPELDGRIITVPRVVQGGVVAERRGGRRDSAVCAEHGADKLGSGAGGAVCAAGAYAAFAAQDCHRAQQLPYEGVTARQRRWAGYAGVRNQPADRDARCRVLRRRHTSRRRRTHAAIDRALHIRRRFSDAGADAKCRRARFRG